jgi:hypothetical protein
MQYTTCVSGWAILAVRLHLLVIVSYLALALLGQEPGCRAGWVTLRQAQGRLCPPVVYAAAVASGRRLIPSRAGCGHGDWCAWRAGSTSCTRGVCPWCGAAGPL